MQETSADLIRIPPLWARGPLGAFSALGLDSRVAVCYFCDMEKLSKLSCSFMLKNCVQ